MTPIPIIVIPAAPPGAIIMCGRVADASPTRLPIRGTKRQPCKRCEQECYATPSTLAILRESKGSVILCGSCVQEVGIASSVSMVTMGQVEEEMKRRAAGSAVGGN